MTKLNRNLLITCCFLAFSGHALADSEHTLADTEQALIDCHFPAAPIIPDGNVASMDELVSAQKAIKAYQEKLIAYRECLHAMEQKTEQEGDADVNTDEDDMDEAQAAVTLDNYNISIDVEEELVEEFNLAVRAYKARQPVVIE